MASNLSRSRTSGSRVSASSSRLDWIDRRARRDQPGAERTVARPSVLKSKMPSMTLDMRPQWGQVSMLLRRSILVESSKMNSREANAPCSGQTATTGDMKRIVDHVAGHLVLCGALQLPSLDCGRGGDVGEFDDVAGLAGYVACGRVPCHGVDLDRCPGATDDHQVFGPRPDRVGHG